MTEQERRELARWGAALVESLREMKRERLVEGKPAPSEVWCSNAQMRALRAIGADSDANPVSLFGWPLRLYDEAFPCPAQEGDVVL